jgi:hypothetical protein
MSPSGFEKDMIIWQASEIRQVGGLMELTVLLKSGGKTPSLDTFTNIPDSMYTEFAALMKRVNTEFGVPVLLRFMPEMNGNTNINAGPWMNFGMRPVEMKQAWIKMTTAIRAATNVTAMVWSPNVGNGYPFFDPNYALPTAVTDPANFAAMNTNGDNVIDEKDDPYGPYYPGIGVFNIR